MNISSESNEDTQSISTPDYLHNMNLTKVKSRPLSTIFLLILIWTFYIYGIFEIGWNRAKFSSTSPLSPPNSSYWFFSVGWWPSCRDLRWQVWRLFSMQFVHVGLLHIGKMSRFIITRIKRTCLDTINNRCRI